MDTTLGQLVLMERALRNINALRFPIKTAYHIHKLVTLVDRELRFFHEREAAWIRELGETDPATGNVTVTPENRLEFFQRLNEMSTLPAELPAWASLTLADLLGAEDPETKLPAKLAPVDLVGLGPLLADEVEPVLPSTTVTAEADTDDNQGAASVGVSPAGGDRAGEHLAAPPERR